MISIICPTYNCCENIGTLINSVFSQTFQDYELIVVDGASTDGTLDILRKQSARLRYISEPDNGIYDAMNKGIDIAKGEWLYFIGADDTLYSDNVIEQITPLLHEDTDVLMCDIMSPKLGRCSSTFSLKTYFTNTIHHQGVIYNRRVLETYRYDTTLRIVADYDMNLYIWKKRFNIEYSNIILANHAPEGVSGQPHFINYKEEITVRNRYIKSKPLQWLLAIVSYTKFILKNLKN